MGTHKNTLIVNGKVLDITGGWRQPSSSSASIDGFIKQHVHTAAPKQPTAAKKPAKPARQHSAHAAGEMHKRREHSHTLMRSAVAKPKAIKFTGLSTSVQPQTGGQVVSAPMLSFKLRQSRAMAIKKNHLISKFGSEALEKIVVKKSEPIHVKPHPAGHHKTALSGHSVKPIIDSIAAQPVSASHDLLAAALQKATAHESKPLKRRHHRSSARKVANGLAIVAVVLALGGFIAYQNVPNIEMRVAASKAGVAGQLPGYKPAGFALSRQIKSSPGKIEISFNSTSDSRNFNISQTASNWNSQTLLDSYVALKDQHYQTFNQPNGQTVYIYGDSNATWVDGGTWYNINGNSNLNNNELLKLANSF